MVFARRLLDLRVNPTINENARSYRIVETFRSTEIQVVIDEVPEAERVLLTRAKRLVDFTTDNAKEGEVGVRFAINFGADCHQ